MSEIKPNSFEKLLSSDSSTKITSLKNLKCIQKFLKKQKLWKPNRSFVDNLADIKIEMHAGKITVRAIDTSTDIKPRLRHWLYIDGRVKNNSSTATFFLYRITTWVAVRWRFEW